MDKQTTSIKVLLRTGLVPLTTGQVIEGGNIIICDSSWVITDPLVIGNPAFIYEPQQAEAGTEVGVLMITSCIVEDESRQEIIEYTQKPKVLIRGGTVQIMVQPLLNLKGRTELLEWELVPANVPTRTILRIG